MADRAVATGFLLTGIAGWVDAQGFLALNGVFVSFMTGNTTLLGLAVAPGNWSQAAPIALVIGLFLAGGFCGAFLSGAAGKWAIPIVLASTAVLLAVAVALAAGGGLTNAGAVLLAFAMGVQNAAAANVGAVRMGATYVTGTLVNAGQELGKVARGTGSLAVFGENMAAWLALLVGVIAGAMAHAYFGIVALAGPCVLTAGLAVLAAVAAARSTDAGGE
jgi:uncharacterized membrane protein YoaK (UPF0700 family)